MIDHDDPDDPYDHDDHDDPDDHDDNDDADNDEKWKSTTAWCEIQPDIETCDGDDDDDDDNYYDDYDAPELGVTPSMGRTCDDDMWHCCVIEVFDPV